MWRETMISISKIENGFIIEAKGKYKRKPKKSNGDEADEAEEVGSCYGEKEIFAKDATDLGQKVESLIPMLEIDEFENEEAFEDAFNKMAK